MKRLAEGTVKPGAPFCAWMKNNIIRSQSRCFFGHGIFQALGEYALSIEDQVNPNAVTQALMETISEAMSVMPPGEMNYVRNDRMLSVFKQKIEKAIASNR